MTAIKKLVIGCGIVLLFCSISLCSAAQLSGNGTADSPYLISSYTDFEVFTNPSTADVYWAEQVHIKLMADIDLNPSLPNRKTYDESPIAPFTGDYYYYYEGHSYKGVFLGNNHTIRNLVIDTNNADCHYLGLFGMTETANCLIKDLTVEATITAGEGSYYTGGLCGSNGSSYQYLQGGMILNCHTEVTINGYTYVGGLCGKNYLGLLHNNSTVINLSGFKECGGLTGNNSGTIDQCTATGSMSSTTFGTSQWGGLCGIHSGEMSDCNSDVTITAESVKTGGLCGELIYNASITNSFATGKITAACCGGLCGECDGTITNCYYVGELTGEGNIGGLCGISYSSTITDSYAICPITGVYTLGGLCGSAERSDISNCYATGSVTGDRHIGGLLGSTSRSTIKNCWASGDASGRYEIGGFCGRSTYSTIEQCYSTGDVSGEDCTGGFCSENRGDITSCYTIGNVSGLTDTGGLCGLNFSGTINNCYSTGVVSGTEHTGGLCGWNKTTIANCYTLSHVSGSLFTSGCCGASFEGGTDQNCYYYIYNGPDNQSGHPLYDDKLKLSSSFVGFDFSDNAENGEDDLWTISPGQCPKLAWQDDDGPLPPSINILTTLSGTGYPENPFQINTNDDFVEFYTNTQLIYGYYVLNTDIDLSGITFTASIVNRLFGGTFDGQGHTINNTTIVTDEKQLIGLFTILTGTIKNLNIDNITITQTNETDYCGGVCGRSQFGLIDNCYVNGSITAHDNTALICGYSYYATISNCSSEGSVSGYYYTGGICGQNYYGTIHHCFSKNSATGFYNLGGVCGISKIGSISNSYSISNTIIGNSRVGGLLGNCYGGEVSNCYAASRIKGSLSSENGGFCGLNGGGTISHCYSASSQVDTSKYINGFCYNNNGTNVNCFWDVEKIEYGESGDTYYGATGKTTAEMQDVNLFLEAGWDFNGELGNGTEDVWHMPYGEAGYPMLFYQKDIPGDITGGYGVDMEDVGRLAGQWEVEKMETLLEMAAYWLAGKKHIN